MTQYLVSIVRSVPSTDLTLKKTVAAVNQRKEDLGYDEKKIDEIRNVIYCRFD